MEMVDEIVKEFLVESYENLDQLDQDLLALEEAPDDRDRLSSVFWAIHTIKGTSGFLAFPKLEHVTHVGENLLVPLRDGVLRLNAEIASCLLEMVDAVRCILVRIDETGLEGDEAYEDLAERLERLKNGTAPPAGVPSPTESGTDQLGIDVESVISQLAPDVAPDSELANVDQANVQEQTAAEVVQIVANREVVSENSAVASDARKERSSDKPANEENELVERTGSSSAADSTVRIDVNVLDRLMNLVGELVLARNQIMECSQDASDAALGTASQRLNLITTELQEGVMKTRMQPIRNAWNKLPRVVRDLSISCGKQVRVEMVGAETELDKTILEAIRDPLTHIVRNSVDHGIESADVRAAAGKSAEGTLWLRAYHEGGQVNIEIADDGAGISVNRVRQKAIDKGMVTAEQAAAMSDREAIQMILLPGFSTAAKVTNVSGRGVGMDVVKTNVEKIGGTLEIQSTVGEGTTLRIKIPLTLAIIPALIVTTSGDRYAIPQVSLLELVRLEGEQVKQSIEFVHGAPVYRLRGKLLPLVDLSQALGTSGAEVGRSTDVSTGQLGGSWDMHVRMAAAKDLAWKSRLRDYLDGREEMLLEDAVSLHGCSLGKWLYGDGLRDFGHLPRVKKLERLHAQMHAAVGKVIESNERGDRKSAETLLLEVDTLSKQTVAILDELNRGPEVASAINIVVLRANDRQYGLIVDKVNDSSEIVVKPLSRQLKGLSEFAGTTIMGDGTVALILDVTGLAIASGLTSQLRDPGHGSAKTP